MKIAVDFDSVIARVIPPTLALMHREYGVYITEDQIKDYPNSFERLGLKSQFFKCLGQVHRSPSLEFVDKWTQPVLKDLTMKHNVYVLTGNPPEQCHLMHEFLKAHGIEAMVASSWGTTKDTFDWDVLVEDDPRAGNFINSDRDVIMYTQEWNAAAKQTGLMRAKTWKQVGIHLSALELAVL